MNVGSPDRIIRIVLGLAAITAGIILQSWWGALGLILIVTAAIGWCPIYRVLRLSSKRA